VWRYRLLRADLQKMECRKFHTIPIRDFVAKYWRGGLREPDSQFIDNAVSAVRRAAKMVGERVEVFYRNGNIYIKIYPSCGCGR